MGVQDRDYYRDDPRRHPYGVGVGGPGVGSTVGSMKWWSVTTWLIVINIAVFVIDGLLGAANISYVRLVSYQGQVIGVPMGFIERWGYFSVDTAIYGLQIWRWISFQFLHAGLGHIFGNMLGLYFFGPLIEAELGRRRFLAFYLICGICGPLVYCAFAFTGFLETTAATPLVGASAGVFGILIAAALTAPDIQVMLLFPPIPMKLRMLAWVLIGIAAFTVFSEGYNAGGEAAHLGGAAAGFLLIRNPRWLNWAEPDWLRTKLRSRRLPENDSSGKSNMKYRGWR